MDIGTVANRNHGEAIEMTITTPTVEKIVVRKALRNVEIFSSIMLVSYKSCIQLNEALAVLLRIYSVVFLEV